MKKMMFTCTMISIVFVLGCKDKSGSDTEGSGSSVKSALYTDSTSGAGYKLIAKAKADSMINHFRHLSVSLRKEGDDKDSDSVTMQNKDFKVRRVVRAKFGQAFLNQLDSNVVGLSLVTAAHFDGAKKDKPTILIRLMKTDPAKSTVETFFYLPDEEDLCPEPPDCSGEIISN